MADLVLTNGNIIPIQQAGPRPDTLVIRQDRIVYAGTAEGAVRFKNPRSTVIDLAGKTVVPGFNDNHLHAVATGDYFSKPNLMGCDAGSIIERLKAAEKDLTRRERLEAFGWDYPDCPHPHRKLLDSHFPDRPVILFQYSGHSAWVNTFQLNKMKVTARTPDPPGGAIERDGRGEPTGILKERALYPIHYRRMIRMNVSSTTRSQLFAKALSLFRENGITSVQDNTWIPLTAHHYNRLKRKKSLTARISCWSYGMTPWARLWMEHIPFDSFWVRKGPRKYFMDGAFSPRTALLVAPYRGEPGNLGISALTPKRLHDIIGRCTRDRRQLALHAIGDGAIRRFLDSLEAFKKDKQTIRGLRFRLEHAQLIQPDDLQRLADWGILLAVQPSALIDQKKDRGLLGEQRARRAYPYRSILDAGIPLSFGSDVPGESTFKPLTLIHMAVNRGGDQAVTPLAALTAYTLGSAHAEFMETEKGSLSPGKLADCAVLSDDPTRCAPKKIKHIQVLMTITGGSIVYRKKGFEDPRGQGLG